MQDLKYGKISFENRPDLSDSSEPCFVIRAQDAFAVGILKAYYTFFAAGKEAKSAVTTQLRQAIDNFIAWPTRKIPD